MFTLKETTDFSFWEKSNPSSSFFPGEFSYSASWNRFLTNTGQSPQLFLIKNNQKKIIGKAVFLIRSPLPFLSYAYCPFGPDIPYQGLKKREIAQIFNQIKEQFKKKHCLFLRFNPPILRDKKLTLSHLLPAIGKTKQPSSTSFLKLNPDPSLILTAIKPKTRYNIRLALKKKLIVKKGYSKELVEDMWKLLQVTGSRSEFSLHPKNYYQKMASSLGPEKKLSIYVAYKKKTPLAAILVINHNKTATYLHGASANIFRNWMAPHLLQWEAIQDACQNNLQYYDFWGVDSEKWPGVTRFKKGFNGTEAVFHPTYDLPLYPIAYQIYQKLYRWLS